MSSNRRLRPRTDQNQPDIVKELRKRGYSVETGHDDILISGNGIKNNIRVEIKDPAKTLLKNGRIRATNAVFTDSQVHLMRDWKGQYDICWYLSEVLGVIHREG